MPNINIEIPEELHKRMRLSALMSDLTVKEFFIRTLERTVTKQRQR